MGGEVKAIYVMLQTARATDTLDASIGFSTYKRVGDDMMLLQHRCSHLSMLVIVVLDEVCVGHAGLLLHENGRFDDFAEAPARWSSISCFQNHCSRTWIGYWFNTVSRTGSSGAEAETKRDGLCEDTLDRPPSDRDEIMSTNRIRPASR